MWDQERNTFPNKPGATHHFIDTRKGRESSVFSVAKNHTKLIVQRGGVRAIEFSLEKVWSEEEESFDIPGPCTVRPACSCLLS